MSWAYVIKRILIAIPTLLGVNLLVFCLFFLVNSPDDMAKQALGEKASTPEQILRWKEARGYDKPMFWNSDSEGIRCVTDTIFCEKSLSLLWGNFGRSDMTGKPIGADIRMRILPSVCVSLPIFLATFLLNIFLAMQAARHRSGNSDVKIQLACVVLMSVSTLIYIIAGQYLLARVLRLVPVSGFSAGIRGMLFLVLPIVIGIISSLGGGVRLYRTLFLEEVSKDYVRTARAKGLSETRVFYVHVLRNALIPILTNVPMQLLMLITGNMLLENFFSIPGLGGFTIYALANQDFAIVRVMVFLGSCLYMLGMLLADICYGLADPRIRVNQGRR